MPGIEFRLDEKLSKRKHAADNIHRSFSVFFLRKFITLDEYLSQEGSTTF